MKPYRLINASELQGLNQYFNQVLQDWNMNYAVMPLQLHLATLPKDYQTSATVMFHSSNQDLALHDSNYQSIINQVLFGTDKTCFNTTSQDLFLILLQQLFKVDTGQFKTNPSSNLDWFYAGSTSLLLTLSCGEVQFTMVLNPDWVYQQLPQHQLSKDSLDSLDEALAKESVTLALELIPSTLSLKQIASIQVGDILSTDHPITTPLRVTRKNEVFAHAELGQSAQHKSIVLKRSS